MREAVRRRGEEEGKEEEARRQRKPAIKLVNMYRGLQVGCHKFATKIRAYAHFWWGF